HRTELSTLSLHDALPIYPAVQGGQVGGADAADGEADAGYPVRVDFRTGEQVVHGADIVPVHDAGPVEAGRDEGPSEELLALAGADRKSTRLNSSHVAISY